MAKVEPYSSKEIFVDRTKIMSKYKENESDRRKLTQNEQRLLKDYREKKLQVLRQRAEEEYDSNKNWSIMIKPRHNDIRNAVMKNNRFE
jgi:hypothetical protein